MKRWRDAMDANFAARWREFRGAMTRISRPSHHRVARRDEASNRVFALTLHVILSHDFAASCLVGTRRTKAQHGSRDATSLTSIKAAHHAHTWKDFLINMPPGGVEGDIFNLWPHRQPSSILAPPLAVSLSLSVTLCLSLSLSIYLSLSISHCLYIYLSIYLSTI